MLLYHGTTRRSAEQIAVEGFAPRKPSRRVWFAHSKGYALRRAKVKARRRHDRPVVLQCELDLATLRRKLGSKRVVYRAGIVSISGSLPVTVLRHAPGVWDPPSSEPELAAWLNDLLGLKAHRGVSRNDTGLIRLARWIRNRRTSQPHSRLRDSEIVERAAGWLPQWFQGVSEATRGYGRPRWPDWRAWAEPKPLTGVHGDCAIPCWPVLARAGPQHAFPAAPHRNAPQQVSWLLRRARDDD